jgi:hypothetical protein
VDELRNTDERDPSITAAAAVGLVAALALILAPAATARLAGIDATPAVVRTSAWRTWPWRSVCPSDGRHGPGC